MIIKQYLDVITGAKTQTRRLKDRYQVGKVYAVVPKMYQYTVHYRMLPDGKIQIWNNNHIGVPTFLSMDDEWKGFIPLKICITGKRHECLHDISEADAIAEGITYEQQMTNGYACRYLNPHKLFPTAKECYFDLWRSINKKPGTRAEDNPMVYAYTFEVVR